MNRRVMHRPMFRKGGSANEGITSGLAPRQGYSGMAGSNWVKQVLPTEEEITTLQKMYGKRPRSTNLNDFLINFGLNLASQTPGANIFQTAAAAAKEPFQIMQAKKAQDEQLQSEREFQIKLKSLDRSDAEEVAKLMSETEGNEFFGNYEGALNKVLDARMKDASPFLKERNPIRAAKDQLIDDNIPATIAEFAAPYQAKIVQIIEDNPDVPFDISQPYAYKGRSKYADGAVYIEPVKGKVKRYDAKTKQFIDITDTVKLPSL